MLGTYMSLLYLASDDRAVSTPTYCIVFLSLNAVKAFMMFAKYQDLFLTRLRILIFYCTEFAASRYVLILFAFGVLYVSLV